MSTATTPRAVRVTIDGIATTLPTAPHLLRVVREDGGVLLVPAECAGVTVEDRTPARTWTEGDVILHGDTVWLRGPERWTAPGTTSYPLDDAAANRTLAQHPDTTEVLRCQADARHWLDGGS